MTRFLAFSRHSQTVNPAAARQDREKFGPRLPGSRLALIGVRTRLLPGNVAQTAREGAMLQSVKVWAITLATVGAIVLAACGEDKQSDGEPVTFESGDQSKVTTTITDADVIGDPEAQVTTTTASVTATATSAAPPSDATSTSAEPPPDTTSLGTVGDSADDLTEVILDLAVTWDPADGVSEEEVAAIAQAQREVLHLLDGTGFRVIALYEVTPQMALAVDRDGLRRLEGSDLVAHVAPNVFDPPTG